MGDAFKALADPTRRHILRSAALITDERRGQNIGDSVNLTVFQELMKWFYDCGLVKGDDSNEKE